MLQIRDNRRIKLLFDNNLTKEDWYTAIDQFLDLILENYEVFPQDNLTKYLSRFDESAKMFYAIINKSSMQIEFYDEKGVKDFFSNFL